MKYPLFEQMNVRIRKEQKEWLYQEADRQEANISVIVRQAIKLYIKEKENVKRTAKD